MAPCLLESNFIEPNMNSRKVPHNFFLYVKQLCPCHTYTQVSFQIHVSADFGAEDISPAAPIGF